MIDSKQKEEKLKRFINELKKSQQIVPFLHLEDLCKYGIRDFIYIAKTNMNFQIIESQLSSYKAIDDFIKDISSVFNAVASYAFQDDPIQQICNLFIQKINKFAGQFKKDAQVQRQSKLKALQTKKAKQLKEQFESKDQKFQKETNEDCVKESSQKTCLYISQKLNLLQMLRKEANNYKLFRQIHRNRLCINDFDSYTIELDVKHPFWQNNMPNKYKL